MPKGEVRVITATVASGLTLSVECDLGADFTRLYIDPTGIGSEVRFQAAVAASAAGGVYRQVYLPQDPLTATVQTNIWKVASAISGGMIEGPSGLRYMKVETTAAVTNGGSVQLWVVSD